MYDYYISIEGKKQGQWYELLLNFGEESDFSKYFITERHLAPDCDEGYSPHLGEFQYVFSYEKLEEDYNKCDNENNKYISELKHYYEQCTEFKNDYDVIRIVYGITYNP